MHIPLSATCLWQKKNKNKKLPGHVRGDTINSRRGESIKIRSVTRLKGRSVQSLRTECPSRFWSAYLLFTLSHFAIDMRASLRFTLLGANLTEQMCRQKHESVPSTAACVGYGHTDVKGVGNVIGPITAGNVLVFGFRGTLICDGDTLNALMPCI